MKKNKQTFLKSFVLFNSVLFFSCQKSNLFKDKNDLDRIDVLYQKSSAAYDSGDYISAMNLASKIKMLAPNEEKNNRNLVKVHLALAGYAFTDIINDIVQNQKSENQTNISNTSDLLSSFSAVFSLSQDDKEKLATKKTDETSNPFFAGLDVYIPNIPGDINDPASPRANIFSLKKISDAIKEACPYIQKAEVLNEQTDGNSRYSCDKAETVKNPDQFYLVYALAHLIEAVQFYEILLYETPGLSAIPDHPEIKGNLARRAQKLNETAVTQTNMADYIQAVSYIKNDTDKILDTATQGSMINETIQNFRIAAKALAAISGLPKSLSSSIDTQMNNLENAKAAANTGGNTQTSTASIFKDQISKDLVAQVKTSVDKLPSDISQEDLTKICQSFSDLAQGLEITKPSKCP